MKLQIVGFPHSGTTALIVNLNKIPNSFKFKGEIDYFPDNLPDGKDLYLIKYPFLPKHIFDNGFKDSSHPIIFLLRNPYYSFSSLERRGKNVLNNPEHRETIEYYEKLGSMFLDLKHNPKNNVFPILYEDLFPNDYKNLKDILNTLNIKYPLNVFKKITNDPWTSSHIPFKEPRPIDHLNFRVFQINQEFTNNNHPEKVLTLSPQVKKRLDKSDIIKKLGYL